VGVQSGKYLDVNAASTADGANVQLWQNTGGNNQKFTFTLTDSNYFRITAVHSGKVLDVTSGSTADGANVQQWTWTGGNNQQWKLVPVSNISNARSSEFVTETKQQPLETTNEMVFYPNPVTEMLTLQLPNGFTNGILKLSDAGGRTLYNQKISERQFLIKTNRLPAGVYFIQINNGSKTISKKFIKK
jgi:hypothetical protein